MMRKIFFIALIATVTMVSCSSSGDDETTTSTDPFIGNWRLVAFVQNGQVIDITPDNIPCFKNSTLTVEASKFSLFFSAPQSQQSTECNSGTETGTWRNEGGKYYISQNGQESEISMKFSDNNTTLQFTYGQGSDAFDLVLKK